jgi:hypothetical protein
MAQAAGCLRTELADGDGYRNGEAEDEQMTPHGRGVMHDIVVFIIVVHAMPS